MDERAMRSAALILLLLGNSALGAYQPREMFVIGRGNAADQLKFSGPCHNYNEDSTEVYTDPGSGPSDAFIDKDGNVVISSYGFRQIKCFTYDGHLVFSFSPQETQNFDTLCQEDPTDIYVDSNLYIYVGSFEPMPYVPVVNYQGEIVEKLYPFPDSQNSKIDILRGSPNGHIYFRERNQGWVTYYNGEFTKTCWAGLLANDGYFYSASGDDEKPFVLYIYRRGGVDSSGHAEYVYTKEIDLGQDSLSYAEELLGGDGNNIYVYAGIYPDSFYRDVIWVYDLNFNKVDELMFPLEEEESYLSIMPFVSAAGEIYEFRFLHDGLHVIKWKK